MQYILAISAYDLMDQITYSACIKDYGTPEGDPPETVLLIQGTFPGSGEPDPLEWLRDLLIGVLERS